MLPDHESVRAQAGAAALAAAYGAPLVHCPGCTSANADSGRGPALERVGLADVREPLEVWLRQWVLPPF